MNETESLDALSDLLTRLSSSPYDISLHAQHLELATSTGMTDQVQAAREMMIGFWPTGDEVWVPMIEAKIDEGVDTVEAAQEVLALFELAEVDYLSIPILQKHITFLIERHAYFSSVEPKPEELDNTFTTDLTRAAIASVVDKGSGHLTQSQLLWDARRDWELELLESAAREERLFLREGLIAIVEDMHLARLKQPHSAHSETFQSYSTFTSSFKPATSYESLLVSASKAKAQAVKSWERREAFETALTVSDYSLESYAYYLANERRLRNPDVFILTALYERAIAEAAKRRFGGDLSAEAALRSFWAGYCDAVRLNEIEAETHVSILKRAARSVPGSGEVWARFIRFIEHSIEDDIAVESVAEVYDRALATGLLQQDIEQIVPLTLARAGYEKRAIEAGSATEGTFETLVKVLEDGIGMVRNVGAQSDPRFRLEKYLSDLYVNLDLPENAITVWKSTAKQMKTSYAAWTLYTDVLIKHGKHDEARIVFKDVSNKNIDWPEAIFEAWMAFEHLYGSIEELEECLDKVERAQIQINARRAREAEKASHQGPQATGAVQATSGPVTESYAHSNETKQSAMEVDVSELAEWSKKRKAEDIGSGTDNKKTKIVSESAAVLKRDRENCTVFVADLSEDVSTDDVTGLFKDCGTIRDVKLTRLPNISVATVEFAKRESIPAALTKDKKRLKGREVAVHLAWRSTLYVTNFPQNADDASMRELFGAFGVIFDVRWPSKKYKNTRRFCYVQFTSPASAEVALSLHGRELEPGQQMNVYISDPEHRKERTDADANNREIYVAGLSKFATRDDLEKLFKAFGVIKEVRMQTDDSGHLKGVAFVEFEEEVSAQRALQANNHDLKNRRIAVTLADSRIRARRRNEPTSSGQSHQKEVMSRSVRIKNLPSGTQEGLLQQMLEKLVAVRRVEVFEDKREATVELETMADSGKLFLSPDPLEFNGAILHLSQEHPEGTSRSQPVAPPTKTGGMFIPRAAISRPRAGLGSKKRFEKPAAENGAGVSSSSSGRKGQEDFRKMLG